MGPELITQTNSQFTHDLVCADTSSCVIHDFPIVGEHKHYEATFIEEVSKAIVFKIIVESAKLLFG